MSERLFFFFFPRPTWARQEFGRRAEETVAFVRSWGLELDPADRSRAIRYAWQKYSTVLQSGNAEMILSAVG